MNRVPRDSHQTPKPSSTITTPKQQPSWKWRIDVKTSKRKVTDNCSKQQKQSERLTVKERAQSQVAKPEETEIDRKAKPNDRTEPTNQQCQQVENREKL
ncbi:hypothetical protein [Pseudomonas saponiphila]|jgi:hypothetical protein|uniref:hypothetical protein n=1 Tax=Pseudomonas saponiphila TaxID=556534 RepID=UPI00115FF63C|nr:hypothetical protein [Pseudomonas saponiphila]